MASPSTLTVSEGSDESSENELLNQSLSVWKGWSNVENETFSPIPLDIYTASSIGQYDCVRHVIQRGEHDLNKPNKGGWTPLMYACYIGHDDIVHILLEAGVSINIKNGKGQRALHLACSCGNESVVTLLLKAGADLEEKDYRGWTALFYATYSGHQNMVKFLLKNGADPEVREPHRGFTPFIEAAAAGHEIIVQYFLLHGVDVNVKALSGHTARSLALDHGHTKIVSMIDNHILSPSMPLRSEAGLALGDDFLSSGGQHQRRPSPWGAKTKYKGPSIQDGPAAFNKVLDQAKKQCVNTKPVVPQQMSYTHHVVAPGYVTFESDGVQSTVTNQIRFRDVTSPINPEDHPLDSSGGQDSIDQEDETSAFTKTGALTIKSSSGSSGGLIAALGLSQDNSSQEKTQNSGENQSVLQRSLSDSVLKGLCKSEHSGHQYQDTDESVDGNHPPVAHAPGVFQTEFPDRNLSPYQHYAQSNLGQVGGAPSISSPNSMPVFPPGQPNFPHNHPISMLQHPLWQQYGYGTLPPPASHNQVPGMACYGAVSMVQPQQTPEADQRNKIGLNAKATLEQKKVFEDRPKDLPTLLHQLGLSKYQLTFDEQDVDLQVFLSLTDNDLKEIGIKLFGPRRKMTNAIARWHSNARPSGNDLEQAYADKLEADMQEMAIQLKLAKEEVSQLKLQVQEEQELRSVTESCLIENSVTWNKVKSLAADTDNICRDLQQHVYRIRQYHKEIKRRIGGTSPVACLTGSIQHDTLAAALKEGLQLEDEDEEVLPEIRKLSTQQLLQHLSAITNDFEHFIAKAAVNTSSLLEMSPSSVPSYS